ncbi:hypothetical protein HPB48_021490 [Haemaphysalis longicornis]|uniref:Uncharacterized protein n=1 Tax=Haemaphysalis longicornis TaxID=44386 RepID=A0A9J6GJE7_HAELO|nr:hypothetical protein HPB48_021490 [Haemaphysalis longicornis]
MATHWRPPQTTTSKNSNPQKIAQLTNEYDDPSKTPGELKTTYITQHDNPKYENYHGSENEALDATFPLSVLKAALQDCKQAKHRDKTKLRTQAFGTSAITIKNGCFN